MKRSNSFFERNQEVTIELAGDIFDFKRVIDPRIEYGQPFPEKAPTTYGSIFVPNGCAVEIFEKLKKHPRIIEINGERTLHADTVDVSAPRI